MIAVVAGIVGAVVAAFVAVGVAWSRWARLAGVEREQELEDDDG